MATAKQALQPNPTRKDAGLPAEVRDRVDVLKRTYFATTARGNSQYLKQIKLEWGLNYLWLEERLAHHGDGKLGEAIALIGCPRSTAYVYRKMAREHLESLSRLKTNSLDLDPDNLSFDLNNPEDVKEILAAAYKGAANVPKHTKRPKPHVVSTQLHFHFDQDTRRKVAAAWEKLKGHEEELKQLSAKIAQEVIDAGAQIKEVVDGPGGLAVKKPHSPRRKVK
jgi:hypothetical protein